jgi:hypothetical protein
LYIAIASTLYKLFTIATEQKGHIKERVAIKGKKYIYTKRRVYYYTKIQNGFRLPVLLNLLLAGAGEEKVD